MTASTAEQPPESTTRRSGAEVVDEGAAPEPPKLRRRPMLIAVSVLLTAVGALLGAWLLTGLSGTESYIAVREGIQRGDVIEESDLVRTQLRADAAVSPLLWDEQRLVVGENAAVDMAAGTLVTRDSVAQQNIPPTGRAIVGMALVPGQTVSGDVQTGDPVEVVIVPTSAEAGAAPESKTGSVTHVDMSSDGTTKLVDVMVLSADAPDISAAAARQEVSLVLTSTEDATSGPDGDGMTEPTEDSSEEPSESPSPSGDESSPSS